MAKEFEKAEGPELPKETELLQDKLQELALQHTLEGPHTAKDAILYHYTNEKAMANILSSLSDFLNGVCLRY